MNYSNKTLHFYVNRYNSHNITITGFVTGFTISESGTKLPNGLSIDHVTGTIYGATQTTGTHNNILVRGYTKNESFYNEIAISVYVERIEKL